MITSVKINYIHDKALHLLNDGGLCHVSFVLNLFQDPS